MRRHITAAAAVLTVLAAAGCSSSAPAKTTPTPTVKAYATHYGDDAALVASHIAGAKDVQAQDDSGLKGEVNFATFTLLGHSMLLYTWKDAASATQTLAKIDDPAIVTARGVGWSSLTADSAPASAQRLIAAMVVKSLGGKVGT